MLCLAYRISSAGSRLRSDLNDLPHSLRADLVLPREIAETFSRSVARTDQAIALLLIDALLYRYWNVGVTEGGVEDNLLGQTQIIKMDCLAPRSPVGVMRQSLCGVPFLDSRDSLTLPQFARPLHFSCP